MRSVIQSPAEHSLHQHPTGQQHAAVRRYLQCQISVVCMVVYPSCVIAALIGHHHAGDHIFIGNAKLLNRHADGSAIAAVVDDDRALIFPAHAAIHDELAVCLQLL